MVFTSVNFLIFITLFVIIYYACALKYRYILLLVTSLFYYVNINPLYVVLLLLVCVSTYFSTIFIDKTKNDKRKKQYLILHIILVLLPLFFFKYFGAINNSMIELFKEINIHWPLPQIKFLLPVGISFYTFVSIGYVIDVYNEDVEVEKNIGILSLLISFFPLLLSGPIERASNLLKQFNNFKPIKYEDISKGLKLMLWGFFMKLVVADRLAIYIDAIHLNITSHNGNTFLLASILYPFQVYADLGGYSLIAIGTAKSLGINVMANFNRPFFAKSMSDFWRRWHISLITWLTDYVYTPLAFHFRSLKLWGVIISLFLTFLLSGIWHGASYTFIVWGIIQGLFLSIEAINQKSKSAFEKRYNLQNKFIYIFLNIFLTFVLFSISQIFGRAISIEAAFTIFYKIFNEKGPLFIESTTLVYSFMGLSLLILSEFRDEFYPSKFKLFENKNIIIRFGSYLFICLYILLFGVLDGGQFIYFQF
jgi:alginate O-acetyltransferase complex protein AlgI